MRQTRSGLIVPDSLADDEAQVFFCTLCNAGFTRHEKGAYERHVVECSNSKEEEIHQMSPRTKAPGIFDRDEIEVWADEHRQELLEGRKKL